MLSHSALIATLALAIGIPSTTRALVALVPAVAAFWVIVTTSPRALVLCDMADEALPVTASPDGVEKDTVGFLCTPVGMDTTGSSTREATKFIQVGAVTGQVEKDTFGLVPLDF